MKRAKLRFLTLVFLLMVFSQFPVLHAAVESIDLTALAKRARPAVMLLVISDASGKEIGTGTGFLVSGDGKLITNHHVIEGGASAIAKAENGGLFPVEGVLSDDPKNDLVLLKLNGKDLPFLQLCSTQVIEVGTRIAVIGSPLGLEGTLSEGIVSAVRDLPGETRLLQITAPVSPGSSGSPALDAQGEVVGVAKALVQTGQALNFAVPAEAARALLAKAREAPVVRPIREALTSDEDRLYADSDFKAATFNLLEDPATALKHAQIIVHRYTASTAPFQAIFGPFKTRAKLSLFISLSIQIRTVDDSSELHRPQKCVGTTPISHGRKLRFRGMRRMGRINCRRF